MPDYACIIQEGQTADQRKDVLSEGLRRATVSVRVTGFKSRPVSVLGAVAQPGNQFVPRQSTLLEILLSAGGLSSENGGYVEVRRRAANGLADQVEIQLKDLLELSRIGRMMNPPVAVPLGDLAVEALALVEYRLAGDLLEHGLEDGLHPRGAFLGLVLVEGLDGPENHLQTDQQVPVGDIRRRRGFPFKPVISLLPGQGGQASPQGVHYHQLQVFGVDIQCQLQQAVAVTELQLKLLEGEKNPLQSIAAQFAEETRVLCFDEFFGDDHYLGDGTATLPDQHSQSRLAPKLVIVKDEQLVGKP